MLCYVESLPEFIAHHTVDKLCLPCTLVLPKSGKGGRGRGGGGGLGGEGGRGRGGGGDGGRVKGGGGDGGDMGAAPQVRRRPVTMQEALKTGAGKSLLQWRYVMVCVLSPCTTMRLHGYTENW